MLITITVKMLSNHDMFSGRMDDSLVNVTQMSDLNTQRDQQHRRAGEPAPPRPTGQYHNPGNRAVNQRLAGLGEQAAARRGGGQGVYNNNNDPHYGTGQGCPP